MFEWQKSIQSIVFEHGAFDFETENQAVEAEIEKAM